MEQISDSIYHLSPGPIDVHAHPRVFDAITQDSYVTENEGLEGKAGLAVYTEVALKSGLTAMIIMPNESLRRYAPGSAEKTELVAYPISNLDRVLAVQSLIAQEAVLPVALHLGVDPKEIYYDQQRTHLNQAVLRQRFFEAGEEVTSLKLYGGETTGGYNVLPEHIPKIVRVWHELFEAKPVVLHLEDENVGQVLQAINQMPEGRETPVHIAHVSSRQELEAVIEAKRAGMNVTCEVTVHHLFLDSTVRDEIDGYGCVKPTLKQPSDIDFLWANMPYIDMIASDCAPHRKSDKEAIKPAFGLATHTVMLPLLFGALADGYITFKELYNKLCINPRNRFNIPIDRDSFIEYDTSGPEDENQSDRTQLELYGFNPFSKLERKFRMVGQVVAFYTGLSSHIEAQTSYSHVIRPRNFEPASQ